MREIKFRGKRIDDKEWVCGNLIIDEGKYYICLQVNDHIKRDDYEVYMVEVIPETVEQYTGLHNKNGVEIYEGDIVKVLINGIWYVGQVIYEHSKFTIDVMNNKQLEFGRIGIIERFTEVIGNIYDNSEKLEGE